MASSVSEIRCRPIAEADLSAVAILLARGFRGRDLTFWQNAMERLIKHAPAPGLPKYGYLIESDGVAVGAILMISSVGREDDAVTTRCNLSSWYVEPAFRPYAPLLVSHALRQKGVTYTNVSPAPHTLAIIEAQGFSRYCDGIFVALPMFKDLFGGEDVKIIDARNLSVTGLDQVEQNILLQHATHGCISLWCVTPDRSYPFVFRPRFARRFIPCAQLIYCRDVADFTRFAGPIGRYLARHGKPIVVVDSNGPIPGLVGTYCRGLMPKYYKGPQRPRLGDLAYSEYALLDI